MVGRGIQTVDLETFHDLLYFTAVRGPHSTGVMTVNAASERGSKNPDLVKRTGPSPYFIMADNSTKFPQLKDRTADVFMAHCRWATVGAHTTENAHPFDTGRYVSCHNGTLYDSWSYASKGSDKTDSQLMFEKMENEGVVDVLQGMRETSAYAITMYDKKNKNVILARNIQRPLYIGISAKRDVLYWASEYGMLYAAATRNQVELKIFSLPVGNVYYLNPQKVKKGVDNPWGVAKLNFQPLETSKSKSRTASSYDNVDWGAWGKYADDGTLSVATASALGEEYSSGSATPTKTYDLTGGPEEDDWEDGIDYNAANGADYAGPGVNDKTRVMTSEELEDFEMSRANPHYKKKSTPGPKAQKAKSKRSSVLADIDELLEKRLDQIDQLFEDVKAQQFQEAAEKAIEEAQGVTASKGRREILNPQYTDDYGENEDCCICNRVLSKTEFMKAEPTEIDGVYFYVCEGCNDDLRRNHAHG